MNIDDLLKTMIEKGASDLHLKSMRPPMVRIKGELFALYQEKIQPEDLQKMVFNILNEKQRAYLEENFYVDVGYSLPGVARFRTIVYYQRSTLGAVLRYIPFRFPSLDDWGLPEVLKEFSKYNDGLVLITGPAGSGKSSTLAALVRLIADTQKVHIVTIEDPIEFLISDAKGSVTQREIGSDARSYADALRNVLRMDPDIVMVGEMRDLETIATVLTAAETGHLVLSTLHTLGAAATIDRLIDAFPSEHQKQIKMQFAQALRGIISLKLVQRVDGKGQIAAVEVLRTTPRIKTLIEEGDVDAIKAEIEKGVSHYRMQTINQSLVALVINKIITKETALEHSPNASDLELVMRKMLYDVEHGKKLEGTRVVESLADYSLVEKVEELKRLYNEMQDKYKQLEADKDQVIMNLEADLKEKQAELQNRVEQYNNLHAGYSKLSHEAANTKAELENKIKQAQSMIQQLQSALPESKKKGIFGR